MGHITVTRVFQLFSGRCYFRPETAKPLNDLAEVPPHGPNSLSRGERDLLYGTWYKLIREIGNDCPKIHIAH